MNVAEYAAFLLENFAHDLPVVTSDDEMGGWYFADTPQMVEIPKSGMGNGHGYPDAGPAVRVDSRP
jgi:hypothetical protein